jgi:hypothetical protein
LFYKINNLFLGGKIDLSDQTGCTPIHYAAKYGHVEMCKYLIERGAQVHLKNRNNQSPYDVAESHSVRQYLLPLVLQAEKAAGDPAAMAAAAMYGGGYTTPSYGAHQQNYYPAASSAPQQPSYQSHFPVQHTAGDQVTPMAPVAVSSAASTAVPTAAPTVPSQSTTASSHMSKPGNDRIIQAGMYLRYFLSYLI